MGSETMNLSVHDVQIEYIRIDCMSHQPEITIYLALLNGKHKKIGDYCFSSQKYRSDIQYRMSGEAKMLIDSVIEGLQTDLLDNYVTFDKTN